MDGNERPSLATTRSESNRYVLTLNLIQWIHKIFIKYIINIWLLLQSIRFFANSFPTVSADHRMDSIPRREALVASEERDNQLDAITGCLWLLMTVYELQIGLTLTRHDLCSVKRTHLKARMAANWFACTPSVAPDQWWAIVWSGTAEQSTAEQRTGLHCTAQHCTALSASHQITSSTSHEHISAQHDSNPT